MKSIFEITRRHFSESTGPVLKTALNNFHKLKGAKMVPFAGYDMPVKYPLGTLKEHLHCRESAGIFDVSHMGQVRFRGKDSAALLERCTVVDTQGLKKNQASLSMLMLDKGTIKDDCIITKMSDVEFHVVLNAGCKFTDLAHIEAVKSSEFKGRDISYEVMDD
jgi:aminomethyltransferase